jgi:YegS/Rv2252/BmrU family lipid kinase
VRAGRRRLLVAGGDGSVHDVVNGLRAAADFSPSPSPVTLGVLPLGTGNDWARSLRMPTDRVELAAVVRRGRVAALDLGRIDFPARGGEAGTPTCWFVNVAGAGFDAHVIQRLPTPLPSGIAYLAGALGSLARYRSPAFQIRIESAAVDVARLDGRFLLAFVANGRYCGHRMKVAPAAMLDDGLLDVVTIDEVGLPGALARLAKLYRGTLLGDPLVRHRQGSCVRIDADPAAVVEADGQIVGRTPAIFSVLPRSLQVLVP